jgi:hypothetical protein
LEVYVKQDGVHDEVWRNIERGYHGSGIALIKKQFATDVAFIDEVANWYLDRGEWVIFHDYEYFLYAYWMLPLGLSIEVRKRLLAGFVKVGFHRHAQDLAAGLGRPLNLDEVQMLVAHYTNGPIQSDVTEKEIRAIAWEVGGELLEGSVKRAFDAMHARSDWRHLLKK